MRFMANGEINCNNYCIVNRSEYYKYKNYNDLNRSYYGADWLLVW